MNNRLLLASAAALAFAAPSIAQEQSAPATDAQAPASTAAPADSMTAQPATDAVAPATPATPAPSDATAATAPAPEATSPTAPTAATAAQTMPDAAAQPAASATATAAADPAKAQAADQMIAQSWSKYDKDNKGQLTPLAFGEWVMAAQGNDMTAQIDKSKTSKAAGLPATKVLNATAAEFSKADTNKDRLVSQEELKAYLSA